MTARNTLWVAVIAVLLALGLVGGGWVAGRAQLERTVSDSVNASRERARVADSARFADSAAYDLFRKTQEARIAGLKRRADSLDRVARVHASRDRGLDSALAVAQSAADSLPIVVTQRDELRLAYSFAQLRGDSLEAATDSLESLVRRGDSLLAVTRRSGAAREELLLAENAALRIRIARMGERGRLFGFLPRPVCVVGYGAVIGPAHGPGAMCGLAIRF